jgi:hypothetical protein
MFSLKCYRKELGKLSINPPKDLLKVQYKVQSVLQKGAFSSQETLSLEPATVSKQSAKASQEEFPI